MYDQLELPCYMCHAQLAFNGVRSREAKERSIQSRALQEPKTWFVVPWYHLQTVLVEEAEKAGKS